LGALNRPKVSACLSDRKAVFVVGSSTIVAPYHDAWVYARIVPMVDYTAKVVSKLLGG